MKIARESSARKRKGRRERDKPSIPPRGDGFLQNVSTASGSVGTMTTFSGSTNKKFKRFPPQLCGSVQFCTMKDFPPSQTYRLLRQRQRKSALLLFQSLGILFICSAANQKHKPIYRLLPEFPIKCLSNNELNVFFTAVVSSESDASCCLRQTKFWKAVIFVVFFNLSDMPPC